LNVRAAPGDEADWPVGAGDKGIGKEIARQLAAAGPTAYVGSRDAGRGQRAVDEIGGNARLLIRAPGQGAPANSIAVLRCLLRLHMGTSSRRRAG
jgi:NAD(P)-dependent dehydrogenase (short-subunit alcohol dehydrogenase family)